MAVETKPYTVRCRQCDAAHNITLRHDSEGFPLDAVGPAILVYHEHGAIAKRRCDCGTELKIWLRI